jgi:hypothetical protein
MRKLAPLDRLRVFLCHAHSDKRAVRALYDRLRSEGFAPWLDSEDILPGQPWEAAIQQAVQDSEVVLVCLSHRSVAEKGFRHKEITFALDVADYQADGTIYIIPVRLEECDVPHRLRRWNWVDLFERHGVEKLIKALDAREIQLGIASSLPFVDLLVLNWVGTSMVIESEEVEDERQELKPMSILSSTHLRLSEPACLKALHRLKDAGYLDYNATVDVSNTSLYHCCWELSRRGRLVLNDFTARIWPPSASVPDTK